MKRKSDIEATVSHRVHFS